MRLPRHPTLIRQQQRSRLKQLARLKPFAIGSLVTLARRCGRPQCRCARGEGHPGWYLSAKDEGKTVIAYVPQAALAEVRQWVQEAQWLKQVTHEISLLSLALLKAQARIRRAQRRRR